MFKVADLDKMSPAQRTEAAEKLRAEALAEETAAEEAQKKIKELQEAYDRQCERAYQLRKLAQTVENFGKT